MADAFFSVVVCFDRGQNARLNFTDKTRAEAAFAAIQAKDRAENDFEIEVYDDFGVRMHLDRDHLVFATIEDPARIVEAEVERSLIVARANAKAQQRAQSDPVLRFAQGSGLTLPGH